MDDKPGRGWSRACLRSALVILTVASLVGCAAERPWAVQDLELFERAYDDSLVVWTADLPRAVVGKAYDFTLQARGQPKPFRWKLISGQLPGGMELGDDGTIHGTPTAPEVARFIIKVACRSQPQSSAFGESPHVDWRMHRFTLVVKDADPSSSVRPARTETTVQP